MRKLLRRPSPAMVVACLALLVALGGTGMAAATQLARNSVGTPQLKDGAVSNAEDQEQRRELREGRSAVAAPLGLRARPAARRAGRPAGSRRPSRCRRCCRPCRPGRRDRRDHRSDRLGRRGRRDGRERRVQHARGSRRSAAATSGRSRAARRWSDDAPGRELMTGELEPQLERPEPGHRVPRRRSQRQRQRQHVHGARSLLHAVRRSTLVAKSALGLDRSVGPSAYRGVGARSRGHPCPRRPRAAEGRRRGASPAGDPGLRDRRSRRPCVPGGEAPRSQWRGLGRARLASQSADHRQSRPGRIAQGRIGIRPPDLAGRARCDQAASSGAARRPRRRR